MQMGCAGIIIWRILNYLTSVKKKLKTIARAVVQKIDPIDGINTRVQQPSLDAIYFIEPSAKTLERIAQVL